MKKQKAGKPSESAASSDDGKKTERKLSSTVSSLRFMNRNKTTTPQPTFKSATSRLVKEPKPQALPPSEKPTTITVPKVHQSEQWSYINEGKLDQIIQQSLSHHHQDLESTINNACVVEEDNESIYSSHYLYGTRLRFGDDDDAMEEELKSSDYEKAGRLKFGTFKQQQIDEEQESAKKEEESNQLKRKHQDIQLPTEWNQEPTKKQKQVHNKPFQHNKKQQRHQRKK